MPRNTHPYSWMTPFYREVRQSPDWDVLSTADRARRLREAIRRRPPHCYIDGLLEAMDERQRWPRALEWLEEDFRVV